ncbi:MAG: sugar phosphate isomerase/epimerase [Clostridia bacterium]|nr:sugar phosphate isomerase/epimerase [Clostridia bacterium]
MRFGFCASPDRAAALKAAGYDYLEGHLFNLSQKTDAEVAEWRRMLADAGMRAEAFNCCFPWNWQLVGETPVSEAEISDYCARAFARAASLGAEVIVLGSGRCRSIPEGQDFPLSRARAQFVRAARLVGDAARREGLRIALEPLRRQETAFIHTLTEGYELVREIDHPAVRLLADFYHVAQLDEPLSDVPAVADALIHCHIAHPVTRAVPAPGDDAGAFYAGALRALSRVGYRGRLSVEANAHADRWESEMTDALAALRAALAAASRMG